MAKSNISSLKSIGNGPLQNILAAQANRICFSSVAIYFMTTEQLQAQPISQSKAEKEMIAYLRQRGCRSEKGSY